MRPSLAAGMFLCAFACVGREPTIAMSVTCASPPSGAAGQTTAAAPRPLVIKGSALERLSDDELARRAIDTSKELRVLAGIDKRDEAAAGAGVHLTYANTPGEVRTYILGQYRFARMKVMDEARELTRRLGDAVEGSDAAFEAPTSPDEIDDAADALEALSRRLVADP
jgi:hypothetical protein